MDNVKYLMSNICFSSFLNGKSCCYSLSAMTVDEVLVGQQKPFEDVTFALLKIEMSMFHIFFLGFIDLHAESIYLEIIGCSPIRRTESL